VPGADSCTAQNQSLFDNLVGDREQSRRYFDAEQLGCLQVDHELEPGRAHDRQVARRAKDHLHLIAPQRFFAHSQRANGDRHMYALRTRFIPPEILYLFESCAWPVAPAATMPEKAAYNPIDIRARMRRMWT